MISSARRSQGSAAVIACSADFPGFQPIATRFPMVRSARASRGATRTRRWAWNSALCKASAASIWVGRPMTRRSALVGFQHHIGVDVALVVAPVDRGRIRLRGEKGIEHRLDPRRSNVRAALENVAQLLEVALLAPTPRVLGIEADVDGAELRRQPATGGDRALQGGQGRVNFGEQRANVHRGPVDHGHSPRSFLTPPKHFYSRLSVIQRKTSLVSPASSFSHLTVWTASPSPRRQNSLTSKTSHFALLAA